MASVTQEKLIVSRFLVCITAAQVSLPGVEGWVGAWAIYSLPRDADAMPERYGDTDAQVTQELAHGMAKAIATAIARTL